MASNNLPQNISIDVDSISLNNATANHANAKLGPDGGGQQSKKGVGKKGGAGPGLPTGGHGAKSQLGQMSKKVGMNIRGASHQRAQNQNQNTEGSHNASYISKDSNKTGS